METTHEHRKEGFTGYRTAAVEAIENVVTVMDPFHVVALANKKLDLCRQRIQQDTLGHRGHSGGPSTASVGSPKPEPHCSPTANNSV